LIPIDHREIGLPRNKLFQEGRLCFRRAAVQIQQRRVGSVLPLDADPLLDGADRDEPRLIDAAVGGTGRSPIAIGALEMRPMA
jgi:hypothetical protein